MKIEIKNLEFKTIIGILDYERTKKQKVVIDCKIVYEYKKDFIDYAEVSQMIETIMIEKKFLLIEKALAYLSEKLKNRYKNIEKLKLTIRKPTVMKNSIVGVSETYKF